MACHRDPAHIQAISVIIVIVAFIDSVIIRAGIYALLVLWVNGRKEARKEARVLELRHGAGRRVVRIRAA